MHRSFVALVAVILSLGSVQAFAQGEYPELYARHARPQPYVDAFVLPAPDGGEAHFVVRIPNSLLVFKREREPLAGSPFVARVELTVQVRSGENLVAERSWRVAHTAESYEVSTSRSHDLVGRIPIALPPGDYSYRVLLGEESGDVFPLATRVLRVPAFANGAVGTPMPVVARSAAAFTPSALGGNLPYGGEGSFLVPVTLSEGESAEALEYVIWRLPETVKGEARRAPARVEDARRLQWEGVRAEDLDLEKAVRVTEGAVSRSDWIAYAPTSARDASTDVSVRIAGGSTSTAFLVPIEVDDVSDAGTRYALEVRLRDAAPASRTVVPFSFHWRDMPIALHDAETAIRLLSFIESEGRIRELLQGSAADREAAFLEYWSERDPTPETPFNELMAEYYRRIDHAALTYRTGGGPVPDGLRTDQARVYIVHGPPGHVDRAFPPSGGVEETWTYDDGRRFVFWAASSLEPLALQRD
ncbi:MAG TPA: GWxTD domain-containing protein [Rhodothermales bacterium]